MGVTLGAHEAPVVLEWSTDGTASRLQHFVWCQPPASVASRFAGPHSTGWWHWGRGWGSDGWSSRDWRNQPEP